MNVVLQDRWPEDAAYESSDPALPGQAEWCCLIPKLHRALASSSEPVVLPRFRSNFEKHEACAYWETAYYLLVRLIGWERHSLGEALRWWYRAGRPTMNDPRFEVLKNVWDDQRQLGFFSLWASGHTVWEGDDFARWAGEEYGPLSVLSARGERLPCVGGSNPLHLGHSLGGADDTAAVLMSPRPSGQRAAIIVNSMRGWHRALERLGGSLPLMSEQHWHVDVYARPVGWLGTFRRSDVTGQWFQGRHSVHTAWKTAI